MDYVTLASGLPASSRLGFGCGSVMGRVGRARSLRAIEMALDAGISHFDVAPSYGYGEAEALVGEALRGKRDQVVIASKFGLNPPRSAGALRALKPIAQQLAATIPAARGVLRSFVGGASAAADRFSLAKTEASLNHSLAALKTDYLDILFLHDCGAGDLSGELVGFLDAQVAVGKIRAYGVATDIDTVVALRETHGGRLIYQFANSLVAHNADRLAGTGCRIVAHSPFAGADTLRGNVGGDVHRTMLTHALSAAGVDVVLCSMLDEAHLRSNLEIAEQLIEAEHRAPAA
ncbi:MAG TPA: aldo/keto reductase [Stellaceae bacterium]|nr:aldo/keto reductase [Stellaceae bacterium]